MVLPGQVTLASDLADLGMARWKANDEDQVGRHLGGKQSWKDMKDVEDPKPFGGNSKNRKDALVGTLFLVEKPGKPSLGTSLSSTWQTRSSFGFSV